jgi:hypothetical protein
MFLANERLLAANMKKEVLDVEAQMISLYTNNLNSIGIQAALVASLAFTALNNVYQQAEISNTFLAYGYNASYTICLISAIIVMSHTTVASMFGPKKALLGTHKDSVFLASEYMRREQAYVLKMGSMSVSMLFVG